MDTPHPNIPTYEQWVNLIFDDEKFDENFEWWDYRSHEETIIEYLTCLFTRPDVLIGVFTPD